MTTTIREQLTEAMRLFREAGVDSPQLDAEVLMAHAVDSTRVRVISHPDQQLSGEELKSYREMVARRVKREPLAYILGYREFWGLQFDVTPAVLIPRPETEILVEMALSQLKGIENPLIADIGVGSGCAAIAIAVELEDVVVYGTELSHVTAEVARRNALKHQVEVRVDILEGHLLDPLPTGVRGKLDAVVSNPPYIPTDDLESLQPEVIQFEPYGALDGGPDGLVFIREILDSARDWLKPGGWVHLEVGISEAGNVADYARKVGYAETRITEDLAGIERVVSARA